MYPATTYIASFRCGKYCYLSCALCSACGWTATIPLCSSSYSVLVLDLITLWSKRYRKNFNFTGRLYFYQTIVFVLMPFCQFIYLIFPGTSHARRHGHSGSSERYLNGRFRRSGSGIQIRPLRHSHTTICSIFLLYLREICLQDSHTRLQLRIPCQPGYTISSQFVDRCLWN